MAFWMVIVALCMLFAGVRSKEKPVLNVESISIVQNAQPPNSFTMVISGANEAEIKSLFSIGNASGQEEGAFSKPFIVIKDQKTCRKVMIRQKQEAEKGEKGGNHQKQEAETQQKEREREKHQESKLEKPAEKTSEKSLSHQRKQQHKKNSPKKPGEITVSSSTTQKSKSKRSSSSKSATLNPLTNGV